MSSKKGKGKRKLEEETEELYDLAALKEYCKSVGDQDPNVEFYMQAAPTNTAAQRNHVFQGMSFFAGRSVKAANVANPVLNAMFGLLADGTAAAPGNIRFASGKQIANFLSWIQNHANAIYGAAHVPGLKMHMRVDGSNYFEISV